MRVMVLASAEETSTWIDLGSTQRGSRGRVFSRMRSKRASPSIVVLCVNKPPVVISSCRVDSLLRPSQKCCNNTWFGIDKSGLECVRIENMSQATPIVSQLRITNLLSQGSNSRYREEHEIEFVPQFFPISFILPYIMGIPLFCPLIKREGTQLPSKSFM